MVDSTTAGTNTAIGPEEAELGVEPKIFEHGEQNFVQMFALINVRFDLVIADYLTVHRH